MKQKEIYFIRNFQFDDSSPPTAYTRLIFKTENCVVKYRIFCAQQTKSNEKQNRK